MVCNSQFTKGLSSFLAEVGRYYPGYCGINSDLVETQIQLVFILPCFTLEMTSRQVKSTEPFHAFCRQVILSKSRQHKWAVILFTALKTDSSK